MSVEDELAVLRLLAQYCQRMDDGDFDGVADLFTPDGTFTFGRQRAAGRVGLVSWFRDMQPPERRGRHLTFNAVVDIRGDRAAVSSDYAFVGWTDGVLTIEVTGRYRDAAVRDGGQWRIERRDCELLRPPR